MTKLLLPLSRKILFIVAAGTHGTQVRTEKSRGYNINNNKANSEKKEKKKKSKNMIDKR